MAKYASSDLVRFGLVTEVTEGTLETASPVPVILTKGITVAPTNSRVTDETISGAGETIDAITNLRGVTITTPATLRYSDCRPLIAAALRDVFPSAVSIVGSSDINMLTAGTHLDGSTGAQITVGDTSSFDDLITYGGVTSTTHPRGGAEGLLMRVSGFVNSENNWHRRIKAVWKNGTTSHIDIEPGWEGGSAGFFGEPPTGETLVSATISVGTAVRNRFTGAGVLSKTGLWQFSDMVNFGKWQAARGLVANDLTFSWSGKDGAMISIPWLGYGLTPLQATDPTAQGFAADANTYSGMLVAVEQLSYFALVTSTKPIILSSLNLNSFSATVAGNCVAIDDVSGTSQITGIRRGKHAPTGTVDYYLVDNVVSQEISALGSEGSAEKAEASWMFTDRAGNEIAGAFLWNEFDASAPNPGTTGNTVSGTSLGFEAVRKTATSRSVVYQEIAAA